MGTVYQFDPKKTVVTFAGIPISGFDEDEFVLMEPNEELFNLQVGADGEATRTRNNNNSGRITITLLSTSASNDALSALFTLDANTPGAKGTGPFLAKDLSGRTIGAAEVAWIVKPAAVRWSRSGSNRVWILETNNLLLFVGGNTAIGSNSVDAAAAINFDTI